MNINKRDRGTVRGKAGEPDHSEEDGVIIVVKCGQRLNEYD